ncbi:unnamed protein product [Pleuronectes platessa]|uniref:PDZ domain-containing protein n=1 Tax=Pleuronectes platessa TaxID=8262 RepID=A0A9N7Z6S2_PLEPL|nr:unnamed protein product [Pleuronectes platessa]
MPWWRAAEASADSLIDSEGRDVQLEESLDLHLPFLLPEGGYSCDTVRGIPHGFREFLEPICRKGLCSITSQPNPKGNWTVYFCESSPPTENTYLAAHREPEVVTITLKKPLNSGMGVSIVAAKGAQQGNLGIYVKSVVQGGPAEMNGRLAAGDQLLSVDGQSLIGLNQERAAAIMVQTGPVVTLQVAKFGASFHGLAALLSEPAPTTTTGHQLHGGSRRKKELMQRNRQLFRSNPNMTTDLCPEDGDELVDPAVRGNNMAAVSTVNLCTDRQALSQENLCMESGGPLLDKRGKDTSAKQPMSHYSSFPIRSSVSTHDLLADYSFPVRHQQGVRTSGAGVWRAPFSQRPTSTPSSQPVRIDIPITRAVNTNPPLTTFQSPALLSTSMSPTPKINGHNPSPHHQAHHNYACPISAVKKLPRPSLPSQQHRPGMFRGQAVKPQVSIPPTKHVSFQEPPTQQRQGTGAPKQRGPQELSGPWRRETQENLEKQHRLQAVELLEQEVQELQAKVKRSAEENDRLRKLSLEWQFQKRLREIQQRGDEEEDEYEDLDMMVAKQQLEMKTQDKRSSGGNINSELKELNQQTGNHILQKEDKANIGHRPTGQTEHVHNVASKENQEEKSLAAPETLTFRERQRLFSLASSA